MKMSREWSNKKVAELLRAVAAALEVKDGNKFKIKAYDEAASSIEHLTSEIKDLWDDGKLEEIPGVGKSLAKHLDELFHKGKVAHFETIFKGLPQAMFELLKIPGVGPKTAYKLCQELKIKDPQTAVEKLQKAAQEGRIRAIEGFGEQSEKDILEGINQQTQKDDRMLLPFAWELAEKIINYLKKKHPDERIEPLGSLRRKTATIGDIDLAVATPDPQGVIRDFIHIPEIKEVVVAGENTARIIHRSGRQIDLKTMKPEAYGALLQHFTGSKQHNIHLREIAQKRGLSLSEYGIKRMENGKWRMEKFATEETFYRALNMDWIPPELREDTGEIEAALAGNLPHLVETKDIKGDLHLHSSFPIETSHDEGADSILTLAEKGHQLHYEYIGLSEHNPSLSQHTPNKIIRILKRKREEVDKINYSRGKKLSIYVFNGLEIDIRPDGSLALPDEGFEYLDFAIVSIHSSFKMSREKMTKRILKAIQNPKIKIIGHPTGRKLGEREGYELDWPEIFSFCKKKDIWLEINAWPNRLDLPDVLVKDAVKNGVKMIIGSDSHQVDQMDLMKYGVDVARRGWATKNDIINTLRYNDLIKVFKGGEK